MMMNHWLKCAPALQHNETHWLLLIILSTFDEPTTVDAIAPIMGRTTRHVWNQLEPLIEAEFVERIAGEGRSCNGRRHRKAHFHLTAAGKALVSAKPEGQA
jgi:DNA-binding MarR family transcriptional regulator